MKRLVRKADAFNQEILTRLDEVKLNTKIPLNEAINTIKKDREQSVYFTWRDIQGRMIWLLPKEDSFHLYRYPDVNDENGIDYGRIEEIKIIKDHDFGELQEYLISTGFVH